MRSRPLLVVSVILGACGGEAPAPQGPPQALTPPIVTAAAQPAAPSRTRPQVCGGLPAREVATTETTFGMTVTDPYRWMEGNDNAELNTWLRAQGECAAKVLGGLQGRDALFTRLRDLGLGTSGQYAMHLAGGRGFFLEIAAGEQLPSLVVREPDGKQRVLVNPAKLGQGGQHASVNAFAPSPDGRRIAYDLALGGGEVSSIHVMEVATGKDLPDVIERVWGEFSAEWMPDGQSFFYTQMALAKPDADPLQNMQARYHVLGQPVTRDVALLGNGAPSNITVSPEEFPDITVAPGTTWALAFLSGAHSEQRVAVVPLAKLDRTGGGKIPWRTVAEYADQVDGATAHGDRLYLSTFKGAPNRKVVSVPLADPDLSKAKVEAAENPEATIEMMSSARDGLYIKTMASGRAHLWRMPWKGGTSAVALPFDGWVDELATDPLRDGARFDFVGWTRPPSFYDADAKGTVKATGIATKTNADYTNIVADEVDATSSDGTRVPLSILHPKDLKMDGSRPAILYGYGAYGLSETPSFSTSRLPWMELGASFAVCHVRGGGEKGRKWQDDGAAWLRCRAGSRRWSTGGHSLPTDRSRPGCRCVHTRRPDPTRSRRPTPPSPKWGIG
jgi:prolyl oligopeptidase